MSLEALISAQSNVNAARGKLSQARAARAVVVATAHANGESIYGIAKTLGVSQSAVRKMLGLTGKNAPASCSSAHT